MGKAGRKRAGQRSPENDSMNQQCRFMPSFFNQSFDNIGSSPSFFNRSFDNVGSSPPFFNRSFDIVGSGYSFLTDDLTVLVPATLS
jgi:spore maturation protein CgeB